MQMSGMSILFVLCIIGGIGLVVFGLHRRSRETCRLDTSGRSSSGPGLALSAEQMGPLGILGERPGPDDGIVGPIGMQTDEELTGQSKTSASPIKKTGSLWDSLKSPMRALRRKEKREGRIPLDIPTATGTALIPKSMKSQPEDPEDGDSKSD